MRRALSFARAKAGKNKPARMAMTAMTTSNSMSVKARLLFSIKTGPEVTEIRSQCQYRLFAVLSRRRLPANSVASFPCQTARDVEHGEASRLLDSVKAIPRPDTFSVARVLVLDSCLT